MSMSGLNKCQLGEHSSAALGEVSSGEFRCLDILSIPKNRMACVQVPLPKSNT
jgi:hypothetical protein